jgi:Nicotinic acid phosphoribosyltransferase
MENSALFTDFYSLTMAQGYWKRGQDERAVFEMFFALSRLTAVTRYSRGWEHCWKN